MDERTALGLIGETLEHAGDDAAVVDDLVLTTDMLHETTDFPAGTTRYTAGWRAVGASLSDVAAMGAEATAAVAVYAAPEFVEREVREFIAGARDVCTLVNAEYVGGDLDGHEEFTVATTALGRTAEPVRRSGATSGDIVCVTGTVGRTAAALQLFDRGEIDRANDCFRFQPRVSAGTALAPYANAMMDSSDGLARSLHQLAEASDCGFAVDRDAIPVADVVYDVVDNEAIELAISFGEDFELVFTLPRNAIGPVREAVDVPIAAIGEVTESGVTIDGEPLPDRGFTHG